MTLNTEATKQFSNLSVEQLNALRDVYHLQWRRLWLRDTGWLNVALGAITIAFGTNVFVESSFPRLIQFVLGIIIVGQSIWAIAVPNNAAFLRFAIVFLLAGIWNLFLGISGGFVGGLFLTGLLGALQLWWAYDTFRGYKRFNAMHLTKPSLQTTAMYDDLWRLISKAALKRDPQTISFRINFLLWRAYLASDLAIFTMVRFKLLIIQPKAIVSLEPITRKPLKKRRIYVRIILNLKPERLVISGKGFRKYVLWKGLDAATLGDDGRPSLWQRLPKVVRIVVWIIGGLIVLYLLWMIIGITQLIIQYG